MNEQSEPTHRVALAIKQRAQAQGWTRKKADTLATECAIGALMGAIALKGEQSADAKALSMFAFMVATRGMAWVNEAAAVAEQNAGAAPQAGG